MPQLDTQTYFAQYVYLVISFGLFYVFVIGSMLPNVIAAEKLRTKLHTLSNLSQKLQNHSQPTAVLTHEQSTDSSAEFSADLSLQHQHYHTCVCKNLGHCAKPNKASCFDICACYAQTCFTLAQKKLLTNTYVANLRRSA